MGPTKAQKFKDKEVVVLSRSGLRMLVPFIGLLLPEEVDFHELAENIVLANPDIIDAKTMDAVLRGIVKNIWIDSLPSIKHRRNKEVSPGFISTLPKSIVDPIQKLEIEMAANATRLLSKPSKDEPNGEVKSSDPLPSITDPSSESKAKADQGVPSTKISSPSRWRSPLGMWPIV